MELVFFLFLFILAIATSLAVIDFLSYISSGKRKMGFKTLLATEIISFAGGPLLFLMVADFGMPNDCCSDSAFFSPTHRVTIYTLIILCTAAYFYSSYRDKLASPVFELIINCFLLTGIILNIFIAIQTESLILWGLGNISIIALFLSAVYKNQQMIMAEISNDNDKQTGFFSRICNTILKANLFIKYPVLIILCLPLLALLSVLLLVFGQKPDSMIRAFTDTYKHGFSQLDYMCDNVQCGGHYLCSVAANGHQKIVKPERYGERNGGKIICNRQLLVANAFEELIEQKLPRLHSVIRKKYNKVGDMVHKYYSVFSNKFLSDIIYVAMKPLEYFFVLVLYTFDKKPENRIAQQYMNRIDRIKIQNKL